MLGRSFRKCLVQLRLDAQGRVVVDPVLTPQGLCSARCDLQCGGRWMCGSLKLTVFKVMSFWDAG